MRWNYWSYNTRLFINFGTLGQKLQISIRVCKMAIFEVGIKYESLQINRSIFTSSSPSQPQAYIRAGLCKTRSWPQKGKLAATWLQSELTDGCFDTHKWGVCQPWILYFPCNGLNLMEAGVLVWLGLGGWGWWRWTSIFIHTFHA